jgi:hypothetical protein
MTFFSMTLAIPFQASLMSQLHRRIGDTFFFILLCELSNVCLCVLEDVFVEAAV